MLRICQRRHRTHGRGATILSAVNECILFAPHQFGRPRGFQQHVQTGYKDHPLYSTNRQDPTMSINRSSTISLSGRTLIVDVPSMGGGGGALCHVHPNVPHFEFSTYPVHTAVGAWSTAKVTVGDLLLPICRDATQPSVLPTGRWRHPGSWKVFSSTRQVEQSNFPHSLLQVMCFSIAKDLSCEQDGSGLEIRYHPRVPCSGHGFSRGLGGRAG